MATNDVIALLVIVPTIVGVVAFAIGISIGVSENPTKEEVEILQGYGFRVGEHELRERLKKLAGEKG